MLEKPKIKNLLISILLNTVSLLIYIVFFNISFETNDDVMMAFIAEGIFGEGSSHLVFSNLILGKIIKLLAGWFPNVKWYCVIYMFMIFAAFCAMTYVLIQLQGKHIGIISSIFLITVLGYNSYVIFQFTRTAAITVTGGAVLLFYALDHAKMKYEKIISVVCGASLVVFGSMVRFEMFGICVIAFAGIGLYKILILLKEIPGGGIWGFISYIIVFGVTISLSLVLYIADRNYYLKHTEWSEYLEYNKLRGELWDLGFPEYEDNEELYQSLEISMNDFLYYDTWNMDIYKMSIETLRTLVNAKEKRTFDIEMIKEFLEIYPKAFFMRTIFSFFLMVSIIAIALNKKNVMLMIYSLLVNVLFVFYLFYINRYGVSRVEISLWFPAIASMLYFISPDLRNINIHSKKIIGVIIAIIIAANSSTFVVKILSKPTMYNEGAKEFFELLSQNDDDLYIFSMWSKPYKLTERYSFWEPSQKKDAKNIYYAGGWNFNLPFMYKLLEHYNIKNVYSDSIDNPNVFWVTGTDDKMLQTYIQENYNSNAALQLIKIIDGEKIYQVRENPLDIECDTFQTDLSDIESDVKLALEQNLLKISGYIYKRGYSTFEQRTFLKIFDRNSKETYYTELTQFNNEECEDIMNGKYSSISGMIPANGLENCSLSIVMQAGGECYEVTLEQ